MLLSFHLKRFFSIKNKDNPLNTKNIFKKNSLDKHQVFKLFNFDVPLETSKVKNTFGLEIIDLFKNFGTFWGNATRARCPFLIKAYIFSEISVFLYKKCLRGRFMLSKHYEKYAKVEQKFMNSYFVKVLHKRNFRELFFDSAFTYLFSKGIVANSSKAKAYKLFFGGIAGNVFACNLNKISQKYMMNKYDIHNFELFPLNNSIITNTFLSSLLFDGLNYFMAKTKKGILMNTLITYFYMIGTGRLFRVGSLFTTDGINLASTNGTLSSLIVLLMNQKKNEINQKYILPLMCLHYFNPYSFWIFIKTKNSFYKEDLDKIYSNKPFVHKPVIYLKYTTLNSISNMLNI